MLTLQAREDPHQHDARINQDEAEHAQILIAFKIELQRFVFKVFPTDY